MGHIVPAQNATSTGIALLASKAYTPGTDAVTYTGTSASLVDVDATNLAVTFVAPASGRVKVRLVGNSNPSGNFIWWGIREGTTNVIQRLNENVSAGFASLSEFIVTGLVAGSTHTYKWAYMCASGATMNMHGGPTYGQFIMEVLDATVAAGGTSSP